MCALNFCHKLSHTEKKIALQARSTPSTNWATKENQSKIHDDLTESTLSVEKNRGS